jgi:hypothetical protein
MALIQFRLFVSGMALILPLATVVFVRDLPVWLLCSVPGGCALLETVENGARAGNTPPQGTFLCDHDFGSRVLAACAGGIGGQFSLADSILASWAAGHCDCSRLGLSTRRRGMAQAFRISRAFSPHRSAVARFVRELGNQTTGIA